VGKWRENGATYKLQSVDGVLLDVLHDVSVLHPLRNSDELSFCHISIDTDKIQDVWMGQRSPEHNFFAKLLETVQSACKLYEIMLTFFIFSTSSNFATLKVFTATRCPIYIPDLTSANPPEARISVPTSISPGIIIDSGSFPWIPASLLNVTKKACFSVVVLRLSPAIP
jgi:hypothetical protein